MSAGDLQAARLLLYEFMETFTGLEMDVAPLAGSDNPTEDLCGRTERFLADGATVLPLGRERLALEAIKAVTTTCKDAVRGLQRILAITSAAGVKAPYHELLANPSVALIVDANRREWAHLFALDAPAATDAAEARARPKRLKYYPDYIDDAEGLERFRHAVLTECGHAMAAVNHNSLGRLIDTIERLRFERDQALATAEAASGAGEREANYSGLHAVAVAVTRFWADHGAWGDFASLASAAGKFAPVAHMALDALNLAGLDADAELASLPPATDPAKPTSEMLDAAEREGWDRAAAEEIWIAMSLAATPTVTADTRGAA